VDPDAFDAFMKAQYYWERLTAESLDSAIHYYQLAMDLEPEWADPYSGMAMTLGAMGSFSAGQKDPNMSGAFDYLEKAMLLDPDAAYSHYVKGIYAVWPFCRWEEGEQEFQRCLELNPSDALCRIYYAHLLMILQRFEEAEEQAYAALELDPMRPLVMGLYGVVMCFLGQYEEARTQAEKALAIDPQNGFASSPLQKALLALGDTLEWYKVKRPMYWWSTPAYLDSLDRVFREQGYLAVIRDRIRINEEVLASGGYISLSGQASRYLQVGDMDRALDFYELALEQGDGFIAYISLDHLDFPDLKTNPRYLTLLEELNLPPPGELNMKQ
jgi:tetratricopeptide (TPR) repeat protein